MNLKIHRGTQEIGGSCVEVWTDTTRIVIDIGIPLVEKNGTEFDFKKYKSLSTKELIAKGILPNISGFYKDDGNLVDGVLISHPHLDHYGFSGFINDKIRFYLGEATHEIIKLSSIFTRQNIYIKSCTYFKKEKPFNIGDFTITPYWSDHSAFDAYSFLIKANDKSIFYSGDFRGHGRKSKVFERLLHIVPKNVDYLLMEGTQVGRSSKKDITETEVENEMIEKFNEPNKINLVYTSSQNIDRLVSIYKACKKSKKILVIDVYIACILKALSKYAAIPFPSKNYPDIRVIFTKWLSERLDKEGYEKLLYQFKHYKITKKEISDQHGDIVMTVRPSMKYDFEHIDKLSNGNIIYSMWKGYLKKPDTKRFLDYLKDKGFSFHIIHTSGHANLNALKQMVKAINPKNLVPIHTFEGQKYKNIFNVPVKELNDGEVFGW